MEAYAVIETGGKQYRVQKDSVIDVETIEGEAGAKISLDRVLAVSDGTTLNVVPRSSRAPAYRLKSSNSFAATKS